MLRIICDEFSFIEFVITALHYVSFVLFAYFCFIYTRTASKTTLSVALPLLLYVILIRHFILASFIIGLIVFESHWPSLLFFGIFVQFNRLVVPAAQLISSFEFIFYWLVNASVAWSPFDVDCLQATHVSFIHGYTVLKRVFLWAFEYFFVLDLGMIEPSCEVFAAVIGEEIFSWGYFWRVGLCLAIEPCSVREKVLFVERIGVVIR